MLKRIFTIFIITLLIFMCGCAKDIQTDGSEKPTVSYEGFTAQSTSGGAELNGCNLRTVTVDWEGTDNDTVVDTVITLDFRMGSNLTEGDSELILRTLPDYTISIIDEPYRLAIRIGKLEHTDYLYNYGYFDSGSSLITDDATFDDGNAVYYEKQNKELILGNFSVSDAADGSYTLYFQLSKAVMYSVEEGDSALILKLRPVISTDNEAKAPAATDSDGMIDVSSTEKAEEGEAYYVLANAFDAYRNGQLNCKYEMKPTLSTDLETILLISKGFTSKGEAKQLLEKLKNGESSVIDSQWSIVKLKNGELPKYESSKSNLAAYDAAPYKTNDESDQISVSIPDGLALAITPDKSACLYSKRIKEYADGGESIEYEQLWLHRYSGEDSVFSSYQFQQIVSASYSPDGRRLAVLEMAGESSHLYVFDVDSRDILSDLSAVGFGETISAYCWDSMGGRIFSIGGSSEIAVHQYDFNVPNEAKRHSIVDKKGCDEGTIGFANGEIFFIETGNDPIGTIYKIKPEGGTRREFISGNNFEISPDSRYMAYTVPQNDSGENDAYIFAYADMQSDEIFEITREFNVFTFFWSSDGRKLYYFENKLNGSGDDGEEIMEAATEEYPYILWVYDISSKESKVVAELMSTSVISGRTADTVYICYKDSETLGGVIRATYALNTAK